MTEPPSDGRRGHTGAGREVGARDSLAGQASAHALEVLEFPSALELVAGHASCQMGRERMLALRPRTDRESARRELSRVGAAMRLLDERPSWALPPVPDVGTALRELGTEGTALAPESLHRIGILLSSSRLVSTELKGREQDYPELSATADLLIEDRVAERDIDRCVDADGEVKDGASAELGRIRARLRGAHARIVRALEGFVASLPERFVVADASVTIRDGRYVVPVRREGRGEVGGIVHDVSHTGATLFIEPPMAIDLMNDLRDLEREEAREVHSIVRELTARLAPSRGALQGAHEALVDLDGLVARARAAASWRGSVPELVAVEGGELVVSDGRHPLLVARGEGPVVPFDLEILPGERAVVVTGPNTGGKSVFLKAVGLLATLAQSGVVPPVGPGTRLPVFGSFYADIGDEQSIAQSLSTFSAHLANLREIVDHAAADSLVLIDEMGTGTDPAEGAALSRAILEELVARGALTLVSSHLGELKRLDTAGSRIVNASLQFDAAEMVPTYRLLKGRPGRSYGLAIARRLGFPEHVLDAAEGHRDGGEAHMEELLTRLERREQEVEELLSSLDAGRRETSRLRDELLEREKSLREAEQSADRRAREDARRLLLEAREEVEEAIREVRAAAEGGGELEAVVHEARRRVEDAAQRQRQPAEPDRAAAGHEDLEVGESVRVVSTGALAKVSELRSERVLVEVAGLRLELPRSDLERTRSGQEARTGRARAPAWEGAVGGPARIEIDLRGLRVDEMELELARAMDRAVYEDLEEMRIIHGKGTGALRKRVGELLDGDARVKAFRMGGPGEGGAGVTVASFRGGG